mmetsp:Transcript_11466/g.16817  ORF Transcript_11466/g.16817 Transcript_11466/m.16817 type:complete len:85 (+) Transcript_11466:625-879(+)
MEYASKRKTQRDLLGPFFDITYPMLPPFPGSDTLKPVNMKPSPFLTDDVFDKPTPSPTPYPTPSATPNPTPGPTTKLTPGPTNL